MARISGVDLPKNKRMEVALTYIYGIGPSWAKRVLESAGIDPDTAHRLHGLRVHRDHMIHPPLRQVFQVHERQQIVIFGQERFQVAVNLARQDRHGLGIEPGRSQHAGQSIKIRVLMGQDENVGR